MCFISVLTLKSEISGTSFPQKGIFHPTHKDAISLEKSKVLWLRIRVYMLCVGEQCFAALSVQYHKQEVIVEW